MDIQIIGINDWALALGNEDISQGRDIPWLQDVDGNQNGISDVWENWDVTYRDVVILDENGEKVDSFNLTVHNLGDPQNYETLRQMFINAAVPEPSTFVLIGLGTIVLALGRRRGS